MCLVSLTGMQGKSSDLPIPRWCIIALWQLCQAKWYQSVWSVSCLLDPHRGHYQSHHAVITTPLVRQLVEYWCLRCQVSKDQWALTRLRWPMDAEADPCQLRWSVCAKWMLIYCLSIDGSDLGGGGWLMAPNGHIIQASLLLSCCFVFVKLLAVNKFTTWWAWFIGLKWMRGNSGYLSEPENLCTIGLYRSVQLQGLYDVCLADTRCVLGVIYHNVE